MSYIGIRCENISHLHNADFLPFHSKVDGTLTSCKAAAKAGATFVKTSTGFAGGGATREDVALMVKHMTNGKKVKAAGGIANLQDAEDFLNLGADRLGTSRIVKAVKELEAKGQF